MVSMTSPRPIVLALLVAACGHRSGAVTDAAIDAGYVPDACDDLGCFQFDCSAKGLPPTTVSGTVFAPNGTLPLYGVDVYVPRTDPGPLADGAVCARCDQGLQGGSYTAARTDEAGHFVLDNVPATADVPIVIQSGKWRRQLVLPNVAACQDLPLDPVNTRLPRTSAEGDIPKIALSTGAADSLECFIRKLGIADSEISTLGQPGRIHLFADTGIAGEGANKFAVGFPGGTGNFASSTTLWNTVGGLSPYDIVILSCEGGQYPGTKSQAAMDALKAYADLGGRVFLSHWHNVWIEGAGAGLQAPAVWTQVSTWNHTADLPNPTVDYIDEAANPKGMAFATWLVNVGASTVRTEIPVTQGQRTALTVDPTRGERWVYWHNGTPGSERTQNFQFTTPNEVEPGLRCGKVVFSDMHVSAGSTSAPATPFPGGCSNNPLTPQEKALAFMFFDIASCVGSIF
jgi:hypothetical protein